MTPLVAWLERRQVALYLAGIAGAGAVGVLVPGARLLGPAIEPVLGLLLYATFLGVPFATIGRSLRDGRFLAAVGVVNFVVVPVIAFALSRLVADRPALIFGVLLVLLTPCVDYVIVFTGLAGGAAERLLAAAPLLMLAQLALLPAYLLLIVGPAGVAVIEIEPFARAFLLLIALPMAAAALTRRWAARRRAGRAVERVISGSMVPLMIATLVVVVASQAGAVGDSAADLVAVVPVFVAFVVVMVGVGSLFGRVLRLDVPARRALLFSGVTRNSLVVLPLALALPASLALAPVVVVTQTLVELVAMVVLVRVVPRLVRKPSAPGRPPAR